MPLRDGITVGEAREVLSSFLKDTGCYDICANCPIYGEDGCCNGCSNLVRGKGCQTPNISCLSYTCGILNMHLSRIQDKDHGNKLTALTDLLYGLPREGYRGCNRKESGEILQIEDPLEIKASIDSSLEEKENKVQTKTYSFAGS